MGTATLVRSLTDPSGFRDIRTPRARASLPPVRNARTIGPRSTDTRCSGTRRRTPSRFTPCQAQCRRRGPGMRISLDPSRCMRHKHISWVTTQPGTACFTI
ncbi:hypothetical protein BC834DRAFT_656663 [Gloeopeniophorella convolvens]|nr:hypothetical protein BC834DRAFT_656663 [Gloeopeniophorella convolvens]